ncbi:MAG: hypothetical protein HQK84_03150 [Nitrospinae bacterium]|nr:hypothetical protein [Nitrospinota bacterium]
MKIEALLDRIIESFTNENFAAELQASKDFYFEMNGRPYEDLHSFESRMNSFLEWFILDKINEKLTKRVIDFLIEDNSHKFTPDEVKELKALDKNIHSIFLTRKIKNNTVKVMDLYSKEKYTVVQDGAKLTMNMDEILTARIVKHDDHYIFTRTYCPHPFEAYKFIKARMKTAKKEGENILDVLFSLNKMSLMWEESRNIDINKIYK